MNELNNFLNDVKKNNKRIICVGAGMMPYYAEQIFEELKILEYVDFFVDNDMYKWNKSIQISKRKYIIYSVEQLKRVKTDRYVLLFTCERADELKKQIFNDYKLSDMTSYDYPEINLDYFKKNVNLCDTFIQTENSIPPIIHYCWFGKGKKNELIQKCIESWRKACPNYKIMEWNEENSKAFQHLYAKEAYAEKKWAYVSDMARLEALYEYGGIYLDADVELIGNLDKLRRLGNFILFGEWPAPNSGSGVGCTPQCSMIKEFIETRSNISFYDLNGNVDKKTNSIYEGAILKRHGFMMNMKYQKKENFSILPCDIIAPCKTETDDRYQTIRTLGRHYCVNSWRL